MSTMIVGFEVKHPSEIECFKEIYCFLKDLSEQKNFSTQRVKQLFGFNHQQMLKDFPIDAGDYSNFLDYLNNKKNLTIEEIKNLNDSFSDELNLWHQEPISKSQYQILFCSSSHKEQYCQYLIGKCIHENFETCGCFALDLHRIEMELKQKYLEKLSGKKLKLFVEYPCFD